MFALLCKLVTKTYVATKDNYYLQIGYFPNQGRTYIYIYVYFMLFMLANINFENKMLIFVLTCKKKSLNEITLLK